MTTVVLADDEALLRKALAALLPLEGDITVVAEAFDGASAVRETLAVVASRGTAGRMWG